MLVLGCALLAGCGSGGAEPSPRIVIAKVAGDAQAGIVGQPLADGILVLVTQDNAPARGMTVNWLPTITEGTLDPESSITDANGLASTRWTLGRFVGVNRVAAGVGGGNDPLVNFTAEAMPDQPAALTKVSGDNQRAVVNTVLQHVRVRVVDQFENAVPGVEVVWSTSEARLTATRVITDPSGISSAQVTLGRTPGAVSIIAAVDGLSGSPQIFAATAIPAEPEPGVLIGNEGSWTLEDQGAVRNVPVGRSAQSD